MHKPQKRPPSGWHAPETASDLPSEPSETANPMSTVCDAERALAGALREMEQLQITLAVMERQHEM